MKNMFLIKNKLSIFILTTGILMNSAVFAAQPQIVVFCAEWNMKCREAKNACASIAQDLSLKYVYLDIDQQSSQQKADDLEINVPSSIPYVYVLDEKGNIVLGELYRTGGSQMLKQEISTKLKK